ncbi:MAG: pilus assembly PilX N-terminal domain-containing protein [Phycisphaerae bacterium]
MHRTVGRGSALLITLIFVALFACMAVALAVAAESNLAISRNRLDIQQARNLTETGLLLVQREMGGLEVTGADATAVHACLADHFSTAWSDAAMLDAADIAADTAGVTFPPLTVPGRDGRTGTITLTMQADAGVQDSATITVTSTGRFNDATRTAYYDFYVRSGYRIFSDYGVASKSPIEVGGGAVVDGANNDGEGSLYSSSDSGTYGIEVTGTSQITGDAAVSGDGVLIDKGNNATIGGDQVTDAPDQDWPTPDPTHFAQYVESTYMGLSTSGGDGDEPESLSNIRIPAGTNPNFSDVNLYGVVYVESPNTVTFNGNTNLCGMVVCEEPTVENYNSNKLTFNGNLTASGVEYLPDDPRYDGIRSEKGTFLLAPGFFAKFNGNFTTIQGYLAAGKMKFSGNAAGTVEGGILNLSDTSLEIGGGAHLTIDKVNAEQHPAGFARRYSLICASGSYRE